MEKIISILLLITIIIAIICTLIVIIDYHKQWKLIETFYKRGNKDDKRRN